MHGFIIIVVFAILIILVYSSPVNDEKATETPKSDLNVVEDLKLANEAMEDKIVELEKRIAEMASSQQHLLDDLTYFHPTVEYMDVDLIVYNWTDALKSELKQQSVPFSMGQSVGVYSFWVFYLTYEKATQSIGITLLLQNNYNREQVFTGFTVSVLDVNGEIFTNMSIAPTNFMEIESRMANLGNVISVSTVQNPKSKLLFNDTLRFKLSMEVLGNGHKLYQQQLAPIPGRDVQIIVFQVKDFLVKMNTVEEDTSSVAHTTFQLNHPWGMITNWNAEIKVELDKTMIALLMECTDMDLDWSQLFASFKVEVSDSQRKIVSSHQAPYHDYKKQLLLFENIITVEKIQSLENDTLEFKLYFVVFNKNARFYHDMF